jgi:hypothetical protein
LPFLNGIQTFRQLKGVINKECFQFLEELSPENDADRFKRKEKGIFGNNESFAIAGQSAARYDTMQMGMELNVSPPCM